MALQRFTNLRGCPAVIFSDPGSQLIGADKLLSMWEGLRKESIYKSPLDNGTERRFSPVGSLWKQGTAESLIKAAKKAIKLTINDQRLNSTECPTLCLKIALITLLYSVNMLLAWLSQ